MASGTVKWFNSTKGFGFIQPDDGSTDVLVHISAVERAGMRGLNDGQKITYELVKDRRCFNGIVRSRRSQALDEWIDDAIDTELTAIMRFASVLRRDIDAVRNAIELPWSNGQAEGQINRLKMLNEQCTAAPDQS